ncbi:OsmC family protein [Pseudofulvibacter geojedonensis]|uniref:OsmC family protein n=1 Tax=Pseudofulvibacter geojedonensis TaxID=1123758 RepID=A0ABW3I321_9FLAO
MKNVKTILNTDCYKAVSISREFEINQDRPVKEGGGNTAPTPVEYLLAAIGGCVSMTIRAFVEKRGWDVGDITVNVFQKNRLKSKGLETYLIEEISFEKDVTEKQKEQLLLIAGKCPVAQMVKTETRIETKII